MKSNYDIIIIGGGPNGLTAAAILAKVGKRVLILEKRPVLGGIGAGEEFHPGYRTNGLLHDTSNVRTGLIQSLQLEKYGLRTQGQRNPVALLSKEGQGIYLSSQTKAAAEEISKYSQSDARAYIEYRTFLDKISQFLTSLTDHAPPDLGDLKLKEIWALTKKSLALKRLGNKTMMELLKVTPMSVADFLGEKFETDFLIAGLAGPAIYGSFTGPRSPYTTLNLLLWECGAKEAIVGGPQALVSALEQSARDSGAEIRTEAAVERILLDHSGQVKGIRLSGGGEEFAPMVAASCTPQTTFFQLLQPNQIEYPLEQGLFHLRIRGTTAKVNLALNKPLTFNCEFPEPIEFARTGNAIDEMEQAFDSVKYCAFSEQPVLDIHIPTVCNPELAPDGHSVASILVHYAPYNLKGGWTHYQKETLGDRVIKVLEQYAPNLSGVIVGREILSPVDLESRYGLTEGNIFHGEHAVDQLITRPVPSCCRYSTPIAGLYLCGSGSHPGGGITCAPGALAAEAILKRN